MGLAEEGVSVGCKVGSLDGIHDGCGVVRGARVGRTVESLGENVGDWEGLSLDGEGVGVGKREGPFVGGLEVGKPILKEGKQKCEE